MNSRWLSQQSIQQVSVDCMTAFARRCYSQRMPKPEIFSFKIQNITLQTLVMIRILIVRLDTAPNETEAIKRQYKCKAGY